MRIVLDPIEEEDIERLVRALDNQFDYTRSRNFEDDGTSASRISFDSSLKRGAWTGRAVFALGSNLWNFRRASGSTWWERKRGMRPSFTPTAHPAFPPCVAQDID